jgi:hypothetical protein
MHRIWLVVATVGALVAAAGEGTGTKAERRGGGGGRPGLRLDPPDETMWEQEARVAICLTGQGSGASWDEPSGLLPAPPTAGTTPARSAPTAGEGFESLEDETGQLSMRVPSGWSQHTTEPVDVGADAPAR